MLMAFALGVAVGMCVTLAAIDLRAREYRSAAVGIAIALTYALLCLLVA